MENNNVMTELIGDVSVKNAAGVARYEFRNIPLEKLTPHPANNEIYKMGEIDELAESIHLAGKVLQNVVVTEADANGNYIILAGHRRLSACQKLVKEGHTEFAEMPCVVIPEKDELMQELFLLQSNSTTRVLSNAEKMHQADRMTVILTKIKKKKKGVGRVRNIVAKLLNTTTGQIARFNVISKGLKNKTLRKAFEQDEIKFVVAYEAARLGEKGQAELAAKMAANGENVLTLRDVEEQRKKDEIVQAGDGDANGIPIQEEYEVNIKKEYKARLTVTYEERDGKFYAGFSYSTKHSGDVLTTPIDKDTPYTTAADAINCTIKKAAECDRELHEALWGSGLFFVGKPEEVAKEPEKTLEKVPESEGKAADDVPTAEPESEKKKYVPPGEYGIRNNVIKEVSIVIDDLNKRKTAKEEEAKKCNEEREERNEKIARAMVDFYEYLIERAGEKKADIENSV